MSLAPARTAVLDNQSYRLLNDLLERWFGLYFPDHRRSILESRLQPRLRALGLETFAAYYKWLCEHEQQEMDHLVNSVTNHETYFFRERSQFDALFGPGLQSLGVTTLGGRLRILSAACSTGEEAYSLAFAVADAGIQPDHVEIDAFDLDHDSVRCAQSAKFRKRSLRSMNDTQIARYLVPDDWGTFQVREPYRRQVRFRAGNLIAADSFRTTRPYDAVFCRNALIYFSPGALRNAVQNLISVLRPGGLLFLGHAESVIGMFPDLETVRLGECIVYRRRAC